MKKQSRLMVLPRGDIDGAIAWRQPRFALEQVFLDTIPCARVRSWCIERRYRAALRAAGLPLRNRILLSGPSGNGKTLLAEAIAGELSLPLGVVTVGSALRSHLGETGARLQRALSLDAEQQAVVLLDEADAICCERGYTRDAGSAEVSRAVAALLPLIDALPGGVVLILATNLPDVFDPAIRRRIDVAWELLGPQDPQDVRRFLGHVAQMRGWSVTPDIDYAPGLCWHDVERAAEQQLREFVIRQAIEEREGSSRTRCKRVSSGGRVTP